MAQNCAILFLGAMNNLDMLLRAQPSILDVDLELSNQPIFGLVVNRMRGDRYALCREIGIVRVYDCDSFKLAMCEKEWTSWSPSISCSSESCVQHEQMIRQAEFKSLSQILLSGLSETNQ